MITRRAVLEAVAVAVRVSRVAGAGRGSEWGADVFDLHFHLRPQVAGNIAHLEARVSPRPTC